jgi:hypothetical protein
MRNGGNYLYYGFGHLTMDNDFLCRNSPTEEWAACTQPEACANNGGLFESKIDIDSYNYVENWL